MTEVNAQLNYLRIAPRKVLLVARAIVGLSFSQAEAVLRLMPKASTRPLLKVLKSAEANAKQNFKLSPGRLYVRLIRVNEGPALKRLFPRARGKADVKKRRSSHITLVLTDEQSVKRTAQSK